MLAVASLYFAFVYKSIFIGFKSLVWQDGFFVLFCFQCKDDFMPYITTVSEEKSVAIWNLNCCSPLFVKLFLFDYLYLLFQDYLYFFLWFCFSCLTWYMYVRFYLYFSCLGFAQHLENIAPTLRKVQRHSRYSINNFWIINIFLSKKIK